MGQKWRKTFHFLSKAVFSFRFFHIIWQFDVKFHMYLDTGGDDDDDYEITLCRHYKIRKGSEKNMGNVLEKLQNF